MKKETYGWVVIFQNGEILDQYPEDGTDNTLMLKEIMAKKEDIAMFLIEGNNQRIGVDFNAKMFILGDMGFRFYSQDESVKPVYFINRCVTNNGVDSIITEAPKVFTVGYEDSKGKVFLNLEEGTGENFFSTSEM